MWRPPSSIPAAAGAASFEEPVCWRAHGAVYGESRHAHRCPSGWAPLRSLRAGAYKYVEAPRPELYNLDADPREQRNLFVKGSPKAAEPTRQLRKLLARYAPKRPRRRPATASPQTRALLDSLGISPPDRAPRWAARERTPRTRLPEFRLYETRKWRSTNGAWTRPSPS